jgi:hypothetical protein
VPEDQHRQAVRGQVPDRAVQQRRRQHPEQARGDLRLQRESTQVGDRLLGEEHRAEHDHRQHRGDQSRA